MSKIKHHPNIETLAAYAAGALDEARSVVIATHMTACDACRIAVRDFEALGGACLETVEPVSMAADAMQSFWARAGAQDVAAPVSKRPANDYDLEAASPLGAYLKGGLKSVKWKALAPGISQHVIEAEGYRSGVLRLLRIQPGVKMPTHTHKDEELTLILRGAYRDEIGEFGRGDLADLDGQHQHTPEAIGDEPCICLIATSAPLVFKGLVGKALQPFVGL